MVLQLVAEGDGICGVTEKFQKDQVDLGLLDQKRTRLADILGRVDRIELLRIKRLEQEPPILAVRGDDQHRSAGLVDYHEVI